MNIFEEEKIRLDYTLDALDNEIQQKENNVENLKKDSLKLSFEDRLRGTHFQLNAQLNNAGSSLYNLKKAKNSPYFGRIDFLLNGEEGATKIYIGKIGISNNNHEIVKDWRAPICSLYYDSELGKVQYDSLSGVQKGDLKLKRQINIKDSKLLDVNDSSLVSNDDLLKPYLSLNADNKMKDIVATIQKEQNNIIRRPFNTNFIVQGVAGSGKTSVALHRIAFLIYNLQNKITSDKFLVIGPNDYFLNYISYILPELDTSPIEQETLLALLNDYTGEKFSIKNYEEKDIDIEIIRKIEKYKSSLKYKNVLFNFMNDYFNEYLVNDDFMIDNQVVFSKELIKEKLLASNSKKIDFEGTQLYLKNKYKDNIESIYEKLNKKYRDIYTSLPFDDPERKKAVEKSNELSKIVKKDGLKLLNKYLKNLDESISQIYIKFISTIDSYTEELEEKEILYLQKNTLMNLKKKNISFVDIPALMYIGYIKNGKKLKHKQVIIDEAQDYGLFHFDVLKEITNNAIFSIYGDLAQSIYSYRSINSWDEVNEDIFDNKCDILELSKSYRTTIEITENANSVLNYLNLEIANPVIRHGNEVLFLDASKDDNYKIQQITDWINKGYKTIAIICKDDKEVKLMEKKLLDANLDVKSLSLNDKEYNGGLFVLTSSASKGLEFDAVIINDASEKIYSSNSDLDMHLLYVASTRALHELIILYNKELTSVYKENNYSIQMKNEPKKLIKK